MAATRHRPTASANPDIDPDRSRLWMARHGETEWSRLGRHTGRTDVPLTTLGRRQARGLGRRLRGVAFSQVLSSPLVRALDTARLAGFGDRVELVPDLMEWDYGAYEGLTTPAIRESRPGWTLWRDGVPEGELASEVAARADRVIARVRAAAGDSLVFAHGHVLRVLAARWLGQPPEDGRLYTLTTAALCVLAWERETPVIERWNEAPAG